jgi:putative ABC transport system permease protein
VTEGNVTAATAGEARVESERRPAPGSLATDAAISGEPGVAGVPAATRTWIIRGVVIVAAVAVFGPMAVDAGAGVWSGSIALGMAFALTAVGVYLTFRVLDFPDLTVDASFPAGAAVAAVVITSGAPPSLALPGAFVIGALLGALTAVAHLTLRINSLLASILTVTAAFTINLRIQGSANVSLLGQETFYTPLIDPARDVLEAWLGDTGLQINRNVVTAVVAAVVLVVLVVLLNLFFRTEVGLALRSTGANQQMSRAQGIDTRRYVLGGVALSNGLIGVSGALVSQHQGFADVNSGAGLIIAGLAAVIIGEVLFAGRSPAIWRHLMAVSLGMVIYRSAIGLTLSTDLDLPLAPPLRLEPTDVRLATAAVVAALLAVPRVRAWQRARSR